MSPHALVLTHKTFHYDGVTGYIVDCARSHWFGTPVKDLGGYGRRRFENWIILNRPKERIKVIYGNN